MNGTLEIPLFSFCPLELADTRFGQIQTLASP